MTRIELPENIDRIELIGHLGLAVDVLTRIAEERRAEGMPASAESYDASATALRELIELV